jgi:hypothetical protein
MLTPYPINYRLAVCQYGEVIRRLQLYWDNFVFLLPILSLAVIVSSQIQVVAIVVN